MLTSRRPYERGRGLGARGATSWGDQAPRAESVAWLTRTCSWLDARPWVVGLANIVAAALFVAGCVGFYWPGLYTGSVTAFLLGSVLFLAGAVGSALLEYGPARRGRGERRDGRPMSAPERGL
jgi:hypothetical protein